jgi:hypothetical protein
MFVDQSLVGFFGQCFQSNEKQIGTLLVIKKICQKNKF